LKPAELFLGILTAVGGFVDVSELVFMSQAGSRFGYALIWVVVLSTIGIMVFGEMSGRVAAIAKQPVFNLMRHRLGLQLGIVTLIASFLSNLITSLTNITLKEIVDDDLAGRGVAGVPVTVISPNFDVHDTAVVDMGLIHIAMDYGYMRAADVMSGTDPHPVAPTDAFTLSDAIIRLRTDTHRMAQLWNRPLEAGSNRTLEELRLRKWLIRKLVEARIASGVALPKLATLWFQRWEQGSSTEPNEPSPWDEFVTFAETRTGIAYANPSATEATVTVTVLSSAGLALGSKVVQLAPNAHGAANLGPLLGLNSFTGSVQITSTVPIVSLSLNAEAFPVFSALPPGDLPNGTLLATGH